ncbi:RICIN domain-containing protein, partial [uncultured Croceitalea sp.]|uniref:RICIN domain-containing protein n=1 Tax=uncultured Croceitalea sp. TaxID=1798908 RepID=UPI00330595BB
LGDYRIVNRGSGKTLQVPSAAFGNGPNVAQGGYAGQDHQHFALEDAGSGYYQFKAIHSNRYLDIELASTAPGANVWQYRGNGSDAQLWEVLDAGDGTFHIVSKLSGHFLGAEPDDNVAVLLNDGSDELRWEFTPAGPPLDLGIT